MQPHTLLVPHSRVFATRISSSLHHTFRASCCHLGSAEERNCAPHHCQLHLAWSAAVAIICCQALTATCAVVIMKYATSIICQINVLQLEASEDRLAHW